MAPDAESASTSYGAFDDSHAQKENGHGRHDYSPNEEGESDAEFGNPQTGVRKIEAISQTWTKWSPMFAYVGYVGNAFLLICSF